MLKREAFKTTGERTSSDPELRRSGCCSGFIQVAVETCVQVWTTWFIESDYRNYFKASFYFFLHVGFYKHLFGLNQLWDLKAGVTVPVGKTEEDNYVKQEPPARLVFHFTSLFVGNFTSDPFSER